MKDLVVRKLAARKPLGRQATLADAGAAMYDGCPNNTAPLTFLAVGQRPPASQEVRPPAESLDRKLERLSAQVEEMAR